MIKILLTPKFNNLSQRMEVSTAFSVDDFQRWYEVWTLEALSMTGGGESGDWWVFCWGKWRQCGEDYGSSLIFFIHIEIIFVLEHTILKLVKK
jgi:hypothetical protein